MAKKESEILKSQSATSSWGGRRKLPNAFTVPVFSYLDELLKKDKKPEPIKRVGFKRKDEG